MQTNKGTVETLRTVYEPLRKHVLAGMTDDGLAFATIEWRRLQGGSAQLELAITGVVGPKANGDATGSCGQCIESVEDAKTCAGSLNDAQRSHLVAVWRRWHLNGMRAGCEHQRAEGWNERPIDASKPTDTYGKHCGPGGPMTWNMLTWVTKRDHPDGLMCEPCPTCGYKYGTAWLYEHVPDDVLAFVCSLPTTDRLPACWTREGST